MTLITSPLRAMHDVHAAELREWARREVEAGTIRTPVSLEAAVEWLPYGSAAETAEAEAAAPVCEIVATYGLVEAEYAAIRRGAAIVDRAQRGVIRVRGSERRDFLNRMLTQRLGDLEPAVVRESFWLSRQGRIEADLVLIETGMELFLDLDRHQVASTVETLSAFLFTEDVEMEDVSDAVGRIALHGPRALEALAAAAGGIPSLREGSEHARNLGRSDGGDPFLLAPHRCRTIAIAGAEVVLARVDQAGEIGVELIVPIDSIETVWQALVATDEALAEGKRRIRPIGWYAFNIARIEAGTPIFNIDFGPTNLPHETGIIHQRVSFTKGCYLGQEIVARMESRGRSKQVLVGLRVEGDALPVAGGQVFESADQIGVVTSSTLSPMLGAVPIAFAMIRTKHAGEGDRVMVNAEGDTVSAIVSPLRFWSEDGTG